MEHESRLSAELRRLLGERRTAALGTTDAEGRTHVSMVPYAIDGANARMVLLVSGLAAHTGHLQRDPRVSLMVADHETPGEPVHALGRFTVLAEARVIGPGGQPSGPDEDPASLRAAYLARFPDAAPIAQLPDFRYVAVYAQAVRQVAGFGAARNVPIDQFERLLRSL